MDIGVPLEAAQAYYKHMFPAEHVYDWLDLSTVSSLYSPLRREFGIATFDGYFNRHLTFSNASKFRKFLAERAPHSVHLGGVYEKDIRLSNNAHNHVLAKEFCIDIDIDDYDLYRTCGCAKKTFCYLCWNYMTIAAKCINIVLDLSLAFKNYQWVFSGGRGLHCWIRDPTALRMSYNNKLYLSKFIARPKKHTGTPYNQMYSQVIKPMFTSFCLESLDIFTSPFARQLVCEYLPAEHVPEFREMALSSSEYFERLEEVLHSAYSKLEFKKLKRQILFKFLYPKIDYNVSANPEHLLRCPFTVHGKSGYIAMPIGKNRISTIPQDLQSFHLHNVHFPVVQQHARILDSSRLPEDPSS